MSHVQSYILLISVDEEKAIGFAKDAAIDLESRKTSLIELVQTLEPFINNDDDTTRSRAVEFLSAVIVRLPSNLLSRQQTQVICQFLCDRMQDGGAIAGLSRIQDMESFSVTMGTTIFRALIENFQDLQTRAQPARLEILSLLNKLMAEHRKSIKSLGSESLIGITDLVSGEKDPRNLMVVFSILRVIMLEWEIEDHAEILFESVFCYFPITFRPPPNDPYGITAQDLKNRLRECIAASYHFAPYAFPQLIDKLDSTSPNVKKDVMHTITACASSYNVITISNCSVTLWDALKFEVLNMQEEDLAEEALQCLKAIAVKLSEGVDSTEASTHLDRYFKPILKECLEHLQEPTHKQAKPAGRILLISGSASPVTLYIIVKGVLPYLMTLFEDAESITNKRALLEILNQVLESALVVYGTWNTPIAATKIENPLNPFKDQFFEINSRALMSVAAEEVSFRIVALRVLLHLSLLQGFLQNNEIGMIVQYLDEIILGQDPNGREDLKREAIQALARISRLKPNLIMDITVPAFMARLPDIDAPERKDYMTTLEALAQLSVEKHVSDTLLRRLLSKLDAVLPNKPPLAYPQAILSTLDFILSQKDLSSDENLLFYHEKLTVNLSTRVALAALGQGDVTALNEDSTLEIIGRMTTKIIRALDTHKQNSVAFQAYTLFLGDSMFKPIPTRKSATDRERLTLILTTSSLAGVDSRIIIHLPGQDEASLQTLLSELINLSLVEDVAAIQRTLLRQVGLITNKFLQSNEIHFAMDLLARLRTRIADRKDCSDNAIRVMFWITKALVLRLSNVEQVLQDVLALLSVKECSLMAARGFGLLLSPDEILSKDNGAKIRMLANQKVFNICVPTISSGFREADTEMKRNYLIALSGILKYVPTEVIMPEINTLLPLLLQSLDLEHGGVKAATIESLTVVCQENPSAIEGHIGSLVSRLLKAANDRVINSADVRHHALSCLRTFPGKVKESALLPYKNPVVRGLMTVLDDPRRNVRRSAVECRASWSKMDEPQSE